MDCGSQYGQGVPSRRGSAGCDQGWLTRVFDSLGQRWNPSSPGCASFVCAHQNLTQETLSCLLQCSWAPKGRVSVGISRTVRYPGTLWWSHCPSPHKGTSGSIWSWWFYPSTHVLSFLTPPVNFSSPSGPPAMQLQSRSWAGQCQSEKKLWRLSATFLNWRGPSTTTWATPANCVRGLSYHVSLHPPITLPRVWGHSLTEKETGHMTCSVFSSAGEHSSLWPWDEALLVPQNATTLKKCIEENHEPSIKYCQTHSEKAFFLQIIFQVF